MTDPWTSAPHEPAPHEPGRGRDGWGAQPPTASAGWTSQANAGPWAGTSTPHVTPYPTPPPGRRVWPWVVGALAGVLILVVGGIVLFVTAVVSATQGPRTAVKDYYADIQMQRYDDAYGLLCSSTQAQTPETTAEAGWVASHDDASFVAEVSISSTTITDDTAVVSGTLTHADSSSSAFTVTLDKEGTWKVCASFAQ